jgi:hypothetical protein
MTRGPPRTTKETNDMDEATLNALVDARLSALLLERFKDSAATGLAIAPHGYNALFNQPGVEPGVMTTYIGPVGLEQALEGMGHVQKSMYLNPVFQILTGQTAGTGDEATTVCSEDVPIPGDLKVCNQTYPFGEFTEKSKPIRVDNAGELINRSEPLDLRLLNNPFADANQIVSSGSTNLFRNKLTKSVVELTNDFKRRYAQRLFTGNVINASYYADGAYGYQYQGLDVLVNTGYTDTFTQTACSAADSYVASFAGAIIQNNPVAYVRTMVETYRARKYLAEQLMVNDVQWAFVMRYQHFLSATEVWPCAYATYRCYTASPSGNAVVIDGTGVENNKLRDAMRDGRYLLIDGEKVPVIIDTTMPELNIGGGNFQSDVYLLPLKSATLGGQLLYLDYFNYRGPFGMQDIVSQLGPQDEYRVSPDGRFAIFFMGGTAFCKQVMIRTRKRLILRAPFLAAKIENVAYAVYQHEREYEPGTSFFEDGGLTSFSGTSFYSSPS